MPWKILLILQQTSINIQIRYFFLYSELNPRYGKERAEKVAGAFPNAEVVEIKQCGHEIPYYGWASYYPVALAYLNQITK